MSHAVPSGQRRTLAIVIALFFYAPQGNISAMPRGNVSVSQAGDFGLRFGFEPCYPRVTESLDTFTGVFTANLGGEPARTVTTPLSLTSDQMTAIYATLENLRVFEYPSTFLGVLAGADEVTTTRPSPTYHLDVRNGGVVHSVSWTDAYKPSSVEADRLRDLLSLLRGFIHEHPAFKRLPPPTVGCM
jgi:hypothetical protein